jgi:hypothetical protein
MIFEGFLFTLAASGMVYSILLALRWKQESRLIFGERRTDFHSAAMATAASSGERATGSGAATGTGTMSRAAAMRRKKFTITWITLRASLAYGAAALHQNLDVLGQQKSFLLGLCCCKPD